ncbi:MAG: triacylglycerol lipase [Solirubrobacteraceae bacterium]|nr:triacylglycerol lipase [Solirubrobacteraceae bacterium]
MSSPIPLLPPIWREGRLGLEAAALLRSKVFRGEDVEDAGGQPVLLIPGFMAGDDSLGLMTRWLRKTGHHTRKAGMRSNVDCSEATYERLAERLDCLAETTGRRVAIIGQSRGGNFAKVLAVRHPDLVSGIVTLGSPQLDPFDIHPFMRAQVFAVGTLGWLGVPGMFSHKCKQGRCCERFWDDLQKPLREDVGYLSVYSRSDGVVRWRTCLDPCAEHLEIEASHCGMAVSPRAWRAIQHALAAFRARDRGPARRRRKPAARRRSDPVLRRVA